MLNLLVKDVEDEYAKENFVRISDYVRTTVNLEGFQLVEVTANGAGQFTVTHTLGYAPKDVIHLSTLGAGTITWLYNQFTDNTLRFSATDACTGRAFVGTYKK
jgi:hypothetical protein